MKQRSLDFKSRGQLETSEFIDRDPTESCGVGLIASIKNRPSREILDLGLVSLGNVSHRGAIGADGKTGDGAGVSTTLPKTLIHRWMAQLGFRDKAELIAIGMLFLPLDPDHQAKALEMIRTKIAALGMFVVGFRDVPVDPNFLGEDARNSMPAIKQVFVSLAGNDRDDFERRLFLARRSIELLSVERDFTPFYVASLSSQTIVYKAMVLSKRLADFYPDLGDPDYHCSACVFHQRFSTNTSPQWELCQPFRMSAHNGEINTIRGNRNWMTSREASFAHPLWAKHKNLIKRLFNFNDSDSASLDNVIELLTLSGRSVEHSFSMLIPPAWENDPVMPPQEKAFFEYYSCFSEPWDGPAAIAMNDGKTVVAGLDRNGLRPFRYKITNDDILIVSSEAGADRLPDSRVALKGRLGPGQVIGVDLLHQELRFNSQIKQDLADHHPYSEWLADHKSALPADSGQYSRDFVFSADELLRRQIAAGMTREEIEVGITQMSSQGTEPTFSMGVDTPLAVLSRHPRNLSDYFKQRFAQVTNPPIDPIREQSVMSISTGIGPERNILDETPDHCDILQLSNPVLLPGQLHELVNASGFRSKQVDCTWDLNAGAGGLRERVNRIVEEVQLAVDDHATIICLSDRNVTKQRLACPMLMVVGAIHHELSKSGQRMMCSLLADTSSVRDSHQLALLFGYGCTGVLPYLAYETICQLSTSGETPGDTCLREWNSYRDALMNGLLKIMSKMGISVLNSYQGAQIFEAIGIGPELMDKCFKYSYSNLGGIGFQEIAEDCLSNHCAGFVGEASQLKHLDLGMTKPRRSGEHHVINGKVTRNLHRFVRDNQPEDFAAFKTEISPITATAIRDLVTPTGLKDSPIPLDEVEPIEEIRKRFTTAAMSLGAVSPEAHEAIAIAMNRIGGKSNSGEGGEDPKRFLQEQNGNWRNSKIKQVASGRFGVDAHYLSSAQEIEIKMAQGAKPGEGGQLPGFKVNELIARLRNTEPGITLISPPPHHDIYSIEDLAQLIYDLKMVNPVARVSVKLVAKTGVGGIAVGVAKSFADTILISGHEGGTGASPLTSIKHAGLPWELGLAEAHQSLVACSLRQRVILRADGGIRTGRDVIMAAILGAEEYNFGTMALIALGCVYVKKCHLNNCPVGIATQDPKYRAKFKGKPENLVNYLNAIALECRQFMAKLGVRSMDELIGQTHLLQRRTDLDHPRIETLNLASILRQPETRQFSHTTQQKYHQPPMIHPSFDDELIETVIRRKDTHADLVLSQEIVNTDRNIGTRLAGFLSSRYGKQGLPSGSIMYRLRGTAGQSLGAFLCPGISIHVAGEANDYVGKGMSGGTISLCPQYPDQLTAADNVIAGNSILYGATGGKLFASGIVAERFCVRNSGAIAVVEGCGDHGCEYMTRGTAVVLGKVGSNFAAGMTGGSAYVLDPERGLYDRLNQQTVSLVDLDASSDRELRSILEEFHSVTHSDIAAQLLDDWDTHRRRFIKVIALPIPQTSGKNPESQPATSI